MGSRGWRAGGVSNRGWRARGVGRRAAVSGAAGVGQPGGWGAGQDEQAAEEGCSPVQTSPAFESQPSSKVTRQASCGGSTPACIPQRQSAGQAPVSVQPPALD